MPSFRRGVALSIEQLKHISFYFSGYALDKTWADASQLLPRTEGLTEAAPCGRAAQRWRAGSWWTSSWRMGRRWVPLLGGRRTCTHTPCMCGESKRAHIQGRVGMRARARPLHPHHRQCHHLATCASPVVGGRDGRARMQAHARMPKCPHARLRACVLVRFRACMQAWTTQRKAKSRLHLAAHTACMHACMRHPHVHARRPHRGPRLPYRRKGSTYMLWMVEGLLPAACFVHKACMGRCIHWPVSRAGPFVVPALLRLRPTQQERSSLPSLASRQLPLTPPSPPRPQRRSCSCPS